MGPKGALKPTVPRNVYLGSVTSLERSVRTRHCSLPNNSEKPVNPAITEANSTVECPPSSVGVRLGAFCENHRRELAKDWFQPGLPGPGCLICHMLGREVNQVCSCPPGSRWENLQSLFRKPLFPSMDFCQISFVIKFYRILCVLRTHKSSQSSP